MIKLGDLGLAKLLENTKASTFAGTLLYMSPEQFRCLSEHGEYTAKTDIWYYEIY
jgi:serine/threonine protein kinase